MPDPRRGRTTALPFERRSHLTVVPDWARNADSVAGLEDVTVRLIPTIHPACRAAISDDLPRSACVRCRWLDGIEDDETAYYDFWAAEQG